MNEKLIFIGSIVAIMLSFYTVGISAYRLGRDLAILKLNATLIRSGDSGQTVTLKVGDIAVQAKIILLPKQDVGVE